MMATNFRKTLMAASIFGAVVCANPAIAGGILSGGAGGGLGGGVGAGGTLGVPSVPVSTSHRAGVDVGVNARAGATIDGRGTLRTATEMVDVAHDAAHATAAKGARIVNRTSAVVAGSAEAAVDVAGGAAEVGANAGGSVIGRANIGETVDAVSGTAGQAVSTTESTAAGALDGVEGAAVVQANMAATASVASDVPATLEAIGAAEAEASGWFDF